MTNPATKKKVKYHVTGRGVITRGPRRRDAPHGVVPPRRTGHHEDQRVEYDDELCANIMDAREVLAARYRPSPEEILLRERANAEAARLKAHEQAVRAALETIILHTAEQLTTGPTPDTSTSTATEDQYVTLQQIATYLKRNKNHMRRELNADRAAPQPIIRGGSGRRHEWIWSQLRPWLETRYSRALPERFPSLSGG